MGAYASVPEHFPSSAQPSSAGMSRRAMLASSADCDVCVSKKKKPKISKFASLKRKFLRTKNHGPGHDYSKALRELTSSWTVRELYSLIDEYDAMSVLKELTVLANMSRPRSTTIVEDLLLLYQMKYCTDIDLVYLGTTFPVHRAILCIRCAFFRELLAHYPEYGAQVPVVVRTPGVDVQLFSALLRYLYTGDFGLEDTQLHGLKKLLAQLASEFGAPNSLEDDLRTLMDTGAYYDAVLVFSNESDAALAGGMSLSSCAHVEGNVSAIHSDVYGALAARHDGTLGVVRRCRNEIRCHKAILAARSTFFRNLVLRRARSGEEMTERALHSPTHIVLDESIIPRRYAQVLLGAVYLDTVDLSCILRSSVSLGTLSEVQAMVSGRGHLTATDEAMELYHIGRFLDFTLLAQGCEDIIVDSVTIDNLINILLWSSEPYGSDWVHRQTLHFLKEEFVQVAHSSVLCELSKEYLIETISSDYLQASELDVLMAVIKWGEYQLVKRIEEREPNLLSHTAHSISRKGVRKRDMNDAELREILADILPHMRSAHIIPAHSDVLTGAVKRGLVCVPGPYAAYDAPSQSTAIAWVRTRSMSLFVKPRLFLPFYREAKAIMKEVLSKGSDSSIVPLRLVHTCAKPDALYMLPDRLYSPEMMSKLPPPPPSFSSSGVDVIAATMPVPDREVVQSMKVREAEVIHSSLAQRAFSLLCCDRRAVMHQIQLRVVREFGLPELAVELLQDACDVSLAHRKDMSLPLVGGGCYLTPLRSRRSQICHHHPIHLYHFQQQMRPSPLHGGTTSPAGKNVGALENQLASDCYSGLPLRNAVPDVAMATATLNHLTVQDSNIARSDLELDLGDGANHAGYGTVYI